MRLIDADALKERAKTMLKIIGEDNLSDYEQGKKYAFETAIDFIDNAPTVDKGYDFGYADGHGEGYDLGKNSRPQGEWIPVSERLPEQANQSYLVTVEYGDGLVCSCQRFFFGENIGWSWNDDCVIAWQMLPKPYMKGGTE